ncbi:MAG: hypothetical protein JJ992_25525, partial [Planctomycetes bacterium]|nr:hypothetical protein [Planctomycetota bacterium]
ASLRDAGAPPSLSQKTIAKLGKAITSERCAYGNCLPWPHRSAMHEPKATPPAADHDRAGWLEATSGETGEGSF